MKLPLALLAYMLIVSSLYPVTGLANFFVFGFTGELHGISESDH